MGRLTKWWRGMRKCSLLRRERATYERLFESTGHRVPDDAELRARVVARCGERHGRPRILAIYHDHNWEGACLGPALSELADVFWADWRDPDDDALSPREGREARHARILSIVDQAHRDGPIDAVFTYLSGEQVGPGTVEALRSLRVPLINLSLNDKESFVGRVKDGLACGMRDIARHFDLCWTSTQDALQKYVVAGASPLYLPEGGHPAVHRALQIPKDIDVAFVGQRYGDRTVLIERLQSAGIDVRAFGAGWPSGPVSTEEMVRIWNRAHIVLGFSGVLGHADTHCLKGRDFEVPMSGACYLTQHHDELAMFYEVGREIATYSGPECLEDAILELLAQPERMEAIRIEGRRRALKDHSWRGRFDKVLRIAGVIACSASPRDSGCQTDD